MQSDACVSVKGICARRCFPEEQLSRCHQGYFRVSVEFYEMSTCFWPYFFSYAYFYICIYFTDWPRIGHGLDLAKLWYSLCQSSSQRFLAPKKSKHKRSTVSKLFYDSKKERGLLFHHYHHRNHY